MKKLFREFLFLKRSERIGLLLSATFLLMSILFRVLYGIQTSESSQEYLECPQEIKQLQTGLKIMHASVNKEEVKDTSSLQTSKDGCKNKLERIQINPIIFNPNDVSLEELRKMNVDRFIAENILKYRHTGGSFAKAEDLRKIYGISDTLYNQLEPYISIPASKRSDKNSDTINALPDEPFFIEINSADTLDLLALPGIGLTYARRILKYRELLGGYYCPAQFWEVYSMDSLRFKSLSAYTWIDTTKIEQIALNTADFREIIRHPYIDKAMTYAILEYREFADSIDNLSEFVSNQIIVSEVFRKVRPYLSLISCN